MAPLFSYQLLLCMLAILQVARGSNIRSRARDIVHNDEPFFDNNDYVLWSKNDTYFQWCRTHHINNYTWGKALSKLVDKAEVKSIVKAMGVKGLDIPQTYAIYNSQNISEFTVDAMHRIPQPFIIKPTHASGGVSRVKNNTYTCLKRCKGPSNLTGERAVTEIIKAANASFSTDYSTYRNELQYKDLPHQIIVEEDVLVDGVKTDVSYWYSANGQPLFVSIQCNPTEGNRLGTTTSRAFVNIKFERLDLQLHRAPCRGGLTKPKNWDQQVAVARRLARHVPGIVRIDLYAGNDRIIFSEFTFTTGFCEDTLAFNPRVADGLLLAVENGSIDPSRATPEFVKNTIHGTSWVFFTLRNGRTVFPASSKAFPSPVDLCEFVNANISYHDKHWEQNEEVKHCLSVAKEAAILPLRCVMGSDETSTLRAISDHNIATISSIMGHIDWRRALALFIAIGFLTKTKVGTQPQKNQYTNNILYYFVLALFLRLTLPNVKGMFSTYLIIAIVRQSFEAFRYVHPMESPRIALSHFATYWFRIAALRSKSLRNLLFWQLLGETVSAFFNEYCHLLEEQNIVHCTRAGFIVTMKEYAFDNLIREYIVSPFCVYGFLLPKFVMHWSGRMLGIGNHIIGIFLFGFTLFTLFRLYSKYNMGRKSLTSKNS
ncbi:hypothetical protein ACHAWX_002640 [Stephanocyclus meneghinianus]